MLLTEGKGLIGLGNGQLLELFDVSNVASFLDTCDTVVLFCHRVLNSKERSDRTSPRRSLEYQVALSAIIISN